MNTISLSGHRSNSRSNLTNISYIISDHHIITSSSETIDRDREIEKGGDHCIRTPRKKRLLSPFRIFLAEKIPEPPNHASVKWPKKVRSSRRRDLPEVPLRTSEHMKIAQEAGLDRNKCSACGIRTSDTQIHHINGKHDDNRPENLQTLCKDCHVAITHGYPVDYYPTDDDGVVIDRVPKASELIRPSDKQLRDQGIILEEDIIPEED